jgi:5,10-methenyltetrahydromethanopterin hydrogenase
VSFPVCLGAVPEDVRVRALAAGRADEDAVSLVPGSFEVGYVAEDGYAHRVAPAGTGSGMDQCTAVGGQTM